jgi:hypothetical protein
MGTHSRLEKCGGLLYGKLAKSNNRKKKDASLQTSVLTQGVRQSAGTQFELSGELSGDGSAIALARAW